MSSSQRKISGKLGFALMAGLLVCGLIASFFVFLSERHEGHARYSARIRNDANTRQQQYMKEFRRQRLEALKTQGTDATIFPIVGLNSWNEPENIVTSESEAGLVSKTRVIDLANGLDWEIRGSRGEGVDVETTIKRAAWTLARDIVGEWRMRKGLGEQYQYIVVSADGSGDRLANRKLQQLVMNEVQRRVDDYVLERHTPDNYALRFIVQDRRHEEFGRVAEVLSEGGRFRSSIIVDSEMMPVPSIPSRWSNRRYELSFRTEKQTSPEFAREDALDGLEGRIIERVWHTALANDQVDAGDYNEFRWSLSEMYSREVLIGMGRRAIQPVRVLLKGVAEEEDAVFYEAEVVWTCGARDVSDVAESVADRVRTRKQGPYIRLGLSFALCILGFLSWLRVDWWLKGHYAFLSKMAFVTLAAAALTVVWNYPLHG